MMQTDKTHSRKVVLRPNVPEHILDWLLECGYVEEVTDTQDEASDQKTSPGGALRSHFPREVDYVQGKSSGPKTDRPE